MCMYPTLRVGNFQMLHKYMKDTKKKQKLGRIELRIQAKLYIFRVSHRGTTHMRLKDLMAEEQKC